MESRESPVYTKRHWEGEQWAVKQALLLFFFLLFFFFFFFLKPYSFSNARNSFPERDKICIYFCI